MITMVSIMVVRYLHVMTKFLSNRRGYSLLELTLVVSITGIMLAFTIPHLRHAVAYQSLQTAGREMAAEIRELQQRALAEEKAGYNILFMAESNKYFIREDFRLLQTKELPPGINLYDTNFKGEKLIINASGYPAYGFGGTVQLENHWGEKLYVIIAKTGRVRISEKPPLDY